MKLKLNYIKNNILYLLTGVDILFVVIFFLFYLIYNQEKIGIINFLDIILKQPALLLLILHPILFFIIINSNRNRTIDFIETNSNKWNIQNKKINEIYQFIEELRTGSSDFEFSTDFAQDKLIKSLNNLKNELEVSRKEEEQRKQEEQQRHWINEGLAKFGAILRENVNDLENLANQVTSNLVKYMNVEQSGFFVIKEEEGEKFIEMLSLYAFDRKKFPDKKFNWGEGLIGACAIEQKTIFIKEASDSFVDITTGLGKANPRSILIVPIKDNSDNVHGVLELASFKIFANFEIDFAEQVAESIGLTMASIKTNLTTQRLLQESQKQAELLAQQETNMRKNIEDITNELDSTLEELDSNQRIIDAINNYSIYFNLNFDKKILNVNDYTAELLKSSSKSTFIDQEFSVLLSEGDKIEFEKNFKYVIEKLIAVESELKLLDSENNYVYIKGMLVPDLDEFEELISVSFVGFNYSDLYIQISDKNKILDTINRTSLFFKLDKEGKIVSVNDKVLESLEYNTEELVNNKFIDLVADKDKADFEKILNSKTESHSLTKSIVSKDNEELTFLFNIKHVYDTNNKYEKTFLSAVDITETQKLKEKNKELLMENSNINEKLDELKNETEARMSRLRKTIEEEFASKEQKVTVFNQFLENIDKAVVLIENETIILFNSYAEKLWLHKKEIATGKKIKYIFPSESEYTSDKNYAGNYLKENVKNKKCFILNKKYEKVEVILNVNNYEQEGKTYINLFLDT